MKVDAAALIDAKGKITAWNAGCQHLFGQMRIPVIVTADSGLS
jgi:PAS domain-containing protein